MAKLPRPTKKSKTRHDNENNIEEGGVKIHPVAANFRPN